MPLPDPPLQAQAKVLTIAGSDSGGGAGIQADLKTITVLGAYGASVVTALTAQNTLGVQGIHNAPVDFVAQQLDSVLSDIGCDAAKTGMLSTPELIDVVASKVAQWQVSNLVVDPVMVAKGGARLLQPEAESALIEKMLPLATLVTPNLHEAEALAGMKVADIPAMKEAAERIVGLGPAAALIKGGHLEGDAVDVLFDGESFDEFRSERIDTPNTHGTGCTYSAAIATFLAQGHTLGAAVAKAKAFVTAGIRHAGGIGAGHGPLNHYAAGCAEEATKMSGSCSPRAIP